jgi:hypothetical protein
MVRSQHDPPHRDPQHARNGKRRDEPLCGGHAQQRQRNGSRRMIVTGFVVMMGHGFLYSVTVRGCRWRRRQPGEVMRKFGAHSNQRPGCCRFLLPEGSVPPPPKERAGCRRSQRLRPGVRAGACTAGISADICSRCAPPGLPNRPMESTSAAANRLTSLRYGSLRTRCSRPIECRDAACGGFSPRPARSPWWHERTAPSWASPSCCFAPTARSHDSTPLPSPRSIQAAESPRPCWQPQRKSRGRADADPCGLKFTKEIKVLLTCIDGPGIMSSAVTVTIIRTAVTRSGSRSNCHLTSVLRKENSHDRLGHRR